MVTVAGKANQPLAVTSPEEPVAVIAEMNALVLTLPVLATRVSHPRWPVL